MEYNALLHTDCLHSWEHMVSFACEERIAERSMAVAKRAVELLQCSPQTFQASHAPARNDT